MADPEVESVAIKAATQIGKTLTLIAILLWCAENAPAPAMLVVPDQDSAVEMRDRIYATAKATIAAGGAKRLKIPTQHKWNCRYINLGSMRVYLAWSGSRQRLRGKPCRYVFLTETDVYGVAKKAGDPIAAAHQRTKAFFRGLHWHESSPSATLERPSEISALEEQASARYRWCCPCPHCGTFQELRFFPRAGSGQAALTGGICGLKNQHGEWLSPEQARQAAHYVCEQGCRIDNDDKQRFLEAGEWRTLDGLPPPSRRSVGRQLWSIHSESISFGTLAAEYLLHKDQGKIPEFFGNWLGLEYKPQVRITSWQSLGKRAAGEHCRKTVPKEAWFLTAGGDVQGDSKGVRYVVRAWGPHCTSWLVDWGWIDRDPGDENELVRSDLKKLGGYLLDTAFPIYDPDRAGHANPLGRRELRVKLANVDSNHLPLKIHHWLQSLPAAATDPETGRLRAIRGDHQVKPELRWRRKVLETNTRTGEEYEGGLTQWGIYVYPFYDDLLEKLGGQPGQPGSWHVTSDTLTQGKSYLEQVCNFAPKVEIDIKTGRKKQTWGPRSGRVEIDYWDCEIYALVAAHMVVGDLGWNPDAWQKWKQAAGVGLKAGGARGKAAEQLEMLDDR